MYKLLNYLFGWDYVLWEDNNQRGVSKICVLPNGYVGYYVHFVFYKLEKPNQVIWLTCHPNKYFK